MLRNMSLLPLKRRNPFDAHSEEPTTTTRPGLFLSEVLMVAAAPRSSGPFLSLLSLIRISPELKFAVAQLLADDEKSFSAVPLSPAFASRVRASGHPVATSFMSRPMACEA